MLSIKRFSRSMNRGEWRYVYRVMRKVGLKIDTSDCFGFRQFLAQEVKNCAVNGIVAVNVSAMDCDCSQYTNSTLIRAIPRAVEREIFRLHDGAEGPMATWVSPPIDRIGYSSRDLALEAFEDGHPHAVYMH